MIIEEIGHSSNLFLFIIDIIGEKDMSSISKKTVELCLECLKERNDKLLKIVASTSIKASKGNMLDVTLLNKYKRETQDIKNAIKQIKEYNEKQ